MRGGAACSSFSAGVGGDVRRSDAQQEEERRAGCLEVRGRAARGWAALAPGSSRSSAPGTCRPSEAEARSGGGESRPVLPSQGASPAGGRRRQSRPPLAAPRRGGDGGRLAGELRRFGYVR